MAYLGNSPGVASQRVETALTATAAQTVFTPTSGYTLGYCDVYQNGVKLVNGDDYTAADGATITLTTGAASGDSIVIVASFPRGLSDGYLKSEADAKYLTIANPTASGNLTFTGTGNRITGDFSNATIANRVAFQTSTANGNTNITCLPNGTGTVTNIYAFNSSDPANSSYGVLSAASTAVTLSSGQLGTGTYLPMTFYTGGSERMRVDTAGNVGIGTSSPASKLQIASGTTAENLFRIYQGGVYECWLGQKSGVNALVFGSGSGSTNEQMRIDSSGNVLVTGAGGLGYGTGSGGTVTQATSKSTAVTLNKPTGQITMNSQALGAGVQAGFQLNNSVISNTDVVVVSLANFAANYIVKVQMGSVGSCTIYLKNDTAGSLSESPVLNFAVIKGATA